MSEAGAPSAPQGSAAAANQLAGALRIVRRRRVLIVLVTAIVLVVALGYALSKQKQYDARADLLITGNQPVTVSDSGSTSQLTDPEREVNNVRQLIGLDVVASGAASLAKLRVNPSSLLGGLRTENQPNSDIVTVVYRDPDPRRAASLANAFAGAFVKFRKTSAQESLQQGADSARERYRQLTPDAQNSEQGRALLARAETLQNDASLQTGGVEQVRNATVPSSAATPKPKLAAVLGLVLGLVLALTLAFLVELIDRRLKEEEDFEAAFGVPIIVSVPQPGRRSGNTRELPPADAGQQEAYGTLAASVRFSAIGGEDQEVLMVTSGGPGEGKTSVTLGLARALSMLGISVIAIECDMRRPAFARYLGLPNTGGLFSVLTGRAELADQLLQIDSQAMRPAPVAEAYRGVTFSVLPAGRALANPQRLLAGPFVPGVIARATSLADVVLIDTAPAGTVNDALALLGVVDRTVLVARYSVTTRDQARRTRRLFENLEGDLLGLVVTSTPHTTPGYYGPAADLPESTPSRA